MGVTPPTMVAFPCRRCWLAAHPSTPATSLVPMHRCRAYVEQPRMAAVEAADTDIDGHTGTHALQGLGRLGNKLDIAPDRTVCKDRMPRT